MYMPIKHWQRHHHKIRPGRNIQERNPPTTKHTRNTHMSRSQYEGRENYSEQHVRYNTGRGHILGWMNQAYSRLSTTHGHITEPYFRKRTGYLAKPMVIG